MAGIVDKIQKLWNPTDDDYDDYIDDEEFEDEYEEHKAKEINSYKEEHASPSLFKKNNNKVVNMNKAQLQVVVYKPVSFGDDTRDIAQALINRNAVVVNFERTPKEESRRILDFLSGVAFAQSGKINKIATATYIITPNNVDLTGDELFDEFENSGYYF